MEGMGTELWPVIGIDLGTSNSCAAIWREGCVEIIPNAQGNRTTPSCVAFTPSQRLVGEAAKKQAEANPTNTIYDSKRLIGRKFSDEIVQNDMKIWPFTVLSGKDEKPLTVVSYKGEVKYFVPEQISAMILATMKETAEVYLGTEVKNAVVTVPAYFNNAQRQATIDAGTIAGLNVIQIINETTAAAIAYGHEEHTSNRNVEPRNILVFNLGGGTLDVSAVVVAKNSFVVKATAGDTHLGGVDFDNSLVNYFVHEFKRKHSKDITGNHRAVERLRVAYEKVDDLYEDVDFCSTLTGDQFEELNVNLFENCIDKVKECLRDAKMDKGEVDDVVVVGGSTRTPNEFFSGQKLYESLHPDEAVASGAAIRAAILSDIMHDQEFVVSDVTSSSIATKDGRHESVTLFPSNTRIPAQKEHTYYTTEHRKTTMPLTVFENKKDCLIERTFNVHGIHLALRMDARVTISFDIDANSILKVTPVTQDIRTESRWTWVADPLTVTEDSGKLSEDEINQMVEVAKKYKMEDIEYEKVEKAKSEVEQFVSNMSVTLSTLGNIKSEEKNKLKDIIRQTTRWLFLNSQLNDARKYEDKLNELQVIYPSR